MTPKGAWEDLIEGVLGSEEAITRPTAKRKPVGSNRACPLSTARQFNLSSAARNVFRADFLRRVAADRHRPIVHGLGLTNALGPVTTVAEMYERLYEAMVCDYRTEYLYKNEVIRRVFEARHNPDRSTVVLERHIAGWASRVDMLVINGTTTAYEVKTDLDDLSRLRNQTDLALCVFDRVVIVSSERWAGKAVSATDDRVGVYALTTGGALAKVRPYIPNADMVDPGAVFGLLRREEYLAAIRRYVGPLQIGGTPGERYQRSLSLFSSISPRVAHGVLAAALRRRHVRPGDAQRLRDIPWSVAHLYYKANAEERENLFSSGTFGRRLG